MEMDPALPGATPSMDAQPQQLKSVTITDNGDGTYIVRSADDASESQAEQAQEPNEQQPPTKSIDEALQQAKQILSGEGKEDMEGIFNAQFPKGSAQEQSEYGSKY
jgi:hypothetical protein